MAKKKESTLINMLVALFVITAVAGGVLGLVFSLTDPKIKEEAKKKNVKAIKEVLPLGDKITTMKEDTLSLITKTDTLAFPCTLVYDSISGEFLGAAVKTSEGGFGGKIEMMVGFNAEGTIKGTSVLSHAETPGLGANMTGPWKDQFIDRNPADFKLAVSKDNTGGNVDAITAATITSRAFTKAVDKAYQAFDANKAQFMGNAPVKDVTPVAEETPVADETTSTEENTENMEGGKSNE